MLYQEAIKGISFKYAKSRIEGKRERIKDMNGKNLFHVMIESTIFNQWEIIYSKRKIETKMNHHMIINLSEVLTRISRLRNSL